MILINFFFAFQMSVKLRSSDDEVIVADVDTLRASSVLCGLNFNEYFLPHRMNIYYVLGP